MKKIILSVLIMILVVGGFWYIKNKNKVPTNPDETIYKNSSLGISFTYPKILTASTTGNEVLLHHEVPFVHHDYCDFKDGTSAIPTLTDFSVKFHIVNKNLVSTMKTESPYIPAENFVNGEVVPSPEFIDIYEMENLKGFKIFEGAEGCGHTIYYLPITESKTLVVINDLITIFTGAIDVESQTKAKAVPGVLNKEKAQAIFDSLMKTLKAR